MRDIAASYSQGQNASKIIFEGVVESQELKTGPIGAPSNAMSKTAAGAHRLVTLRVLRAYRGINSEKAVVLTGIGLGDCLGDCGFDFQMGMSYLVYADKIDEDNLFTSICTGTSILEHSGPAVRFLRGEPPTPDDLLDFDSYYKKFTPQWTGSACGRVTKSDGTPLGKASVELTQIRDEPFPPATADDPDTSKPDGSFCVPYISPGKYLLTAETTDFDASFRWMGFYPSVTKHSEARPIEIRAGEKLNNLNFTVSKQQLFTVSFRIVAPDGSAVPLDRLGVAIDSTEQGALAYHLTQNRDEDGKYFAGYVPPGRYRVQTYVLPDFETGGTPAAVPKWRMANQELEITSASEIILKLNP